jgi:site-specific recombinase XerD
MKPEVMAAHGGDLQDQLGHASLATKDIYLKVSPNHRKDAYAVKVADHSPFTEQYADVMIRL